MSKSVVRSIGTVGSITLISRIFGFMRDLLVAHMFGAGFGYDAFLMAFKIPNFTRRLFAEGAFSQAFVPILSEYHATKTPQEVKALVDRVSGLLGVSLLIVSILGIVFAPFLIRVFAPGFEIEGTRYPLAVEMLRITFAYSLFISLTAFASGVLNTHGKFAIPACTPVILNLTMMTTAFVLSPILEVPVVSLAYGVLLAGVLQFCFQIPALYKLNLVPRFHIRGSWQDSGVKRILTLMVPAIFGASVMQINLLIDSIFASYLPDGSVSWLYYSDRLLEFPLGVFGIALATVVLPNLSQKHALANESGFTKTLDWALRVTLLIGLPSLIGITMLAEPIMVTLFQYGKFTSNDAYQSARALSMFSLGLVSYIAIKILVSAYYAKQNTKFPVKVGVIALLVNVLFNFLLIGSMQHAGLALASVLSACTNAVCLLIGLLRSGVYKPSAGWMAFGFRLALANLVMALFIFYVAPGFEVWVEHKSLWRFMNLTMIIGGGFALYVLCLGICGLRLQHLSLASVN